MGKQTALTLEENQKTDPRREAIERLKALLTTDAWGNPMLAHKVKDYESVQAIISILESNSAKAQTDPRMASLIDGQALRAKVETLRMTALGEWFYGYNSAINHVLAEIDKALRSPEGLGEAKATERRQEGP